MKKFGKFIGTVVPFFAVIGIQLLVSIMMSAVFFMIYFFRVALQGKENFLNNSQQITKISQEISTSSDFILCLSISATLICGVIFFFWLRKLNRDSFKVNRIKRLSIQNILLILLLGVSCQACLAGVLSFVQPFFKELFDEYSNTINSLLNGNMFFVVLYTIIIAPIAEEIIFRGVILHKARKLMPFIGANILQAVLFGIYHMNIIQGIYAGLLGLVLGYMVRKFETIYASILLHMCVNASSFLVGVIPENTVSSILLIAIGGVLLAVSLIGMTKTVVKPFGQEIYGDHLQ